MSEPYGSNAAQAFAPYIAGPQYERNTHMPWRLELMFERLGRSARWLANETGLRFLARRKAACAVAVLTMALALGANTAVFSVVERFLLSSIGVPEAGRLFVVAPVRNLPGRGSVAFNEAYPNYLLLRGTQHAFADV